MSYAQKIDLDTTIWRDTASYNVVVGNESAMLKYIVTALSDKDILSNLTYSGAGDGKIRYQEGGVGGITQTWTITFDSATTFTVEGSVDGVQDPGTDGVMYTTTGVDPDPNNSLISFRTNAGDIPWEVGDEFTMLATENPNPTTPWLIDNWDPARSYTDDGALWWHGVGNGSEAIYCGMQAGRIVLDDKYWIRGQVGTGYDDQQGFEGQPGICPSSYTPFWTGKVEFWLVWDSRRYIMIADNSTKYYGIYQGFFLPYGSPEEYPYPIVNILASDTNHPWSAAENLDVHIVGMAEGSGHIRDLDGTWLEIQSGTGQDFAQLWPNGDSIGKTSNTWPNTQTHNNGDRQLFPISVVKPGVAPENDFSLLNTYGVLDGIRRITGFGGGTGTIFTIGGTDHVAFQDGGRNEPEDFVALEMT